VDPPLSAAFRPRSSRMNIVFWFVVAAGPVAAFTQNTELEAKLGKSDVGALALLPSKGYKNGAAGFFMDHDFYVVPGSERAWCQDRSRGVLKAGCYVELFFQRRGQRARDPHGDACGFSARWFKASGEAGYVPTPGSPFAGAIAAADSGLFDRDMNDPPAPAHFKDARRLESCTARSSPD